MTLKKITLSIYFLTLALPLWPTIAAAQSMGNLSADPAWSRYLVTDPVFRGETFIMESGKGGRPTMVLVHGAGDEGSRIWEPFLQEYGAEYHLLTFDLPGFGRSAKQNLLYSPANYSAFLKWVISEYAPGPVVLLGHSMGGALALHFAATWPDLVTRLVLVDAAGILHRSAFSKNFLQLESPKKLPKILAIPLEKPIVILNHLSGTTVERIERQQSGEDIEAILGSPAMRENLLGGNPKTIASLAVAQEDFSPLLRRISAPTYIIWGENDDTTPVRTGVALAAIMNQAKLEIIENAGHTPIREQTGLFHQALRRALLYQGEKSSANETFSSARTGSCDNLSGITFTGNYESIEIRRCTNVHLRGVTAGYVRVFGSNIEITNSLIRGKDIGLSADHSKITATDLTVHADVAISASGSTFDLAAVVLSGREAAIRTTEQSSLLFSISTIDSPFFKGAVHGIRRITGDTPM